MAKISLGELCPDLNKIRIENTKKSNFIDTHTQARINTIAHKVEKIGGDIVPVLNELRGLIISKRDFIVTVGYDITHLSEVRNNKFFGKVIASRLKLNNKMLYVCANGAIFPITWNNYAQIWRMIVGAPQPIEDDKIEREKIPSYMRLFEDAQKDNITRKKAQSGKKLPRTWEMAPALSYQETQRITITLDF